MNIFDNLLLKLVLKPKKLYRKMGVDTHQLLCILMTKLEIDDRTPSPLMKLNKRRRSKGPTRSVIWFQFFMSVLMGLSLTSFFAISDQEVTALSVYYSAFIFLLIFMLLSGLSNILLDPRDNYIILPKPVDGRTITISRILHILVRVASYGIPMLLPGLIVIGIFFGFGTGLVAFLMLLLSILFSVFIVNIIYLFYCDFYLGNGFSPSWVHCRLY